VRAMSLDRPPLPQLSLGAWQLKERGIEVAAVRVWHEVKDRAVEVRQAVQELTGQVREWLDRAAEQVLDRLGPGQSSQAEMALAGGRDRREEEPDRSDRSDLATRLRDAWEARQGREKEQGVDVPERERDAPQDLAARLREAAEGVDREGLADRAAALRESREAEERHTAQEAAQEQERVKELERQQEIKRDAHRDRGHGIER